MTRKSATAVAEPTVEVEEAPGEAIAEGQLTEKMSDAEIMAAIQAQIAERQAQQAAAAPAKVSVEQLFNQSVALVAAATGKRFRGDIPSVSENAAVKLYELALMWALNNRDTTSGQIMPPEDEGATSDGPVGPDHIDEIIGGQPAETE